MTEDHLTAKIKQLEEQLEQARDYAKTLGNLLEKNLNETHTLYHISRTIASQLDLQEMLRQVTLNIQKAISVDRVTLYIKDENAETATMAFFSGLPIEKKTVLKAGEGVPGRIIESGEHVHIHDLTAFYETFNDFIHFPGEEKRDGSYIGISLRVHNTTIGAIGMDSQVKYGLGVEEMDFMAILSHQIAAGIEKSRLFEKIQQLSELDGLTGLYNHRLFHDRLNQEINRRNRTGKPLSLIMLDIDHFKRFNDTYGHQAGDAALKELSEIIVSQSRCNSIDVCCRYGGEEFAIILPELEIHNAVKVAERLRRVVEGNTFSVTDKNIETGITVSLGVAGITADEDIGPEELVKKADDALYLSKKSGRNRVSYAPVSI